MPGQKGCTLSTDIKVNAMVDFQGLLCHPYQVGTDGPLLFTSALAFPADPFPQTCLSLFVLLNSGKATLGWAQFPALFPPDLLAHPGGTHTLPTTRVVFCQGNLELFLAEGAKQPLGDPSHSKNPRRI